MKLILQIDSHNSNNDDNNPNTNEEVKEIPLSSSLDYYT